MLNATLCATGRVMCRIYSPQTPHMLNATLCATGRVMCCIMENYQTKEGVRVPRVLQPFMAGMDFIPFTKPAPVDEAAKKKAKAAKKK